MAFAKLEIDAAKVEHLAALFKQAEAQAPAAIKRAVFRTGTMAKTRMIRALVKQTGLKRAVLARALVGKPAGGGYQIKSRGGNVHLKYFGARETRKGVSAAPWNKRRVYGGTFTRGGKFPHRVGLNLGGQVYMRAGRDRTPISSQRSGRFIPKEMISGASEHEFLAAVATILPARLQHEIAAILAGHA